MRMVLAAALLVTGCDAGCGGEEYAFGARMIVGIEPQTISADDLPADATHIVVRGANEVVFPLVPVREEAAHTLIVDSEFMIEDVQQAIDSTDAPRVGQMGVFVPLLTFEPITYPESDEYVSDEPPPPDTWRGSFEVELRSAGTSVRVRVDVAPVFSPCTAAFLEQAPPEYAPNARIEMAVNSTATCLDGTACLPRGTLLDRDEHSIAVGPFIISTRVQAWCQASSG